MRKRKNPRSIMTKRKKIPIILIFADLKVYCVIWESGPEKAD